MDFKVRNLMFNVDAGGGGGGGGGGGAMLPVDDQPIPTPVTPFTPIISVVDQSPVFDRLAVATAKVIREGNADLNPGIARLVDEVALQVGRVAVATVFVGGGAGMPNPDCGGSSLETIPTPITPVVHQVRGVLRAEHLGQLKQRLTETVSAIEKVQQRAR